LVARRDGDDYVVNGTKTWISNGIHGKVFALLVKTDPAKQPRHAGTSLFLAEKGPGFSVSRKLEKLGYKGIDSAELVFEDFRIPADRLIGGKEGFGLRHEVSGHKVAQIPLQLGRSLAESRGRPEHQQPADQHNQRQQRAKIDGFPAKSLRYSHSLPAFRDGT